MKSWAGAGFNRVELIAAIVFLGMIAAVAFPRFVASSAEVRVTAVKNMGGSLRSAANLAHSACMAQACANGSIIVITGKPITFVNGYPNRATIGNLVQGAEGFTPNVSGDTFAKNGSRTDQCWVRYTEAAAGQEPTISYRAGAVTSAASETIVNNALRQQC